MNLMIVLFDAQKSTLCKQQFIWRRPSNRKKLTSYSYPFTQSQMPSLILLVLFVFMTAHNFEISEEIKIQGTHSFIMQQIKWGRQKKYGHYGKFVEFEMEIRMALNQDGIKCYWKRKTRGIK